MDHHGDDDDAPTFRQLTEELVATKSALAAICRASSSKEDLLSLAAVNKSFHEVAHSEHVWDRLYERDFPYFYGNLVARRRRDRRFVSYDDPNDSGVHVPWFTEYKKRHHRERCWQTGNLSRKAPLTLGGHLGCVFGACFLGAPFTPGTICTGAHLDRTSVPAASSSSSSSSSGGEIKMWLPNRGTTIEQVVREYGGSGDEESNPSVGGVQAIPEGMDVETFTKQEIARAGVLSLYQLPGTAQIACTTWKSGVHILRCRAVAEEVEQRYGNGDGNGEGKGGNAGRKRMKRDTADQNQRNSKGYSFDAVLEVMGQEAPCSKTFVDKKSRILALPSYDGAVRLYLLPRWITDCGEIAEEEREDGAGKAPKNDNSKPKIHPSSTLYDDAKFEIRGEDGTNTTGTRAPVTALTMSDDCKRMFTGSNDTLVKLWDMEREKIVHRFEGHEGFIWNVKGLDADLNNAVSTSTDGFARRWDLRQRTCAGSINVCAHPGNVQAVTGVALRGNGYHMAVGSFDSNVYVLDTRMMRRLYSVGRHGDKVCRAHLYDKGDCGDLLMTTGWDRTVRLWQFD